MYKLTMFIKFNEGKLETGEFIDGVYFSAEALKTKGIKNGTPTPEKKEEPKRSSISDDEFGELGLEALK